MDTSFGPQGRTTLILRNSGVLGLRTAIDDGRRHQGIRLSVRRDDRSRRHRRPGDVGVYILAGPRVCYAGETCLLSRRLIEHAGDPVNGIARETFVVTVQKGVASCASDPPPWRKDNVDRILVDTQPLLFDLGFRGFDAVPAPDGAAGSGGDASADADDDDAVGTIEIGVSIAPPGVEEFEMRYMNVWARGYEYLGRFIVTAGSEIREVPNASVSVHTQCRREQLFDGHVEPIPGVTDRQRLKVAVALPSRAIAAKVCAGAHCGTDKWRPLGRTPVIVAN